MFGGLVQSIKIQALVRRKAAKKLVQKRREEYLAENATIIQNITDVSHVFVGMNQRESQ